MTPIEKTSQLPTAIGMVLKSAFPQLLVGNHQGFIGAEDKAGVLIRVELNAPGARSPDGRKAHTLLVSLKAMVPSGSDAFDVCDLASQLMDLALDNRWGLPSDQCDVPTSMIAAPFGRNGVETDYDTWIVSFTQPLYIDRALLDDPTGKALFSRGWDVLNIDDPDQYRPLQE